MIEQTPNISLTLIIILTLVLYITPMLTVTSNSTPTFATPELHTSQKSSSLYCYTVYTNTAHPDHSISMQFYVLNFLPFIAGYTGFSTVLAKILFAMVKPQPAPDPTEGA